MKDRHGLRLFAGGDHTHCLGSVSPNKGTTTSGRHGLTVHETQEISAQIIGRRVASIGVLGQRLHHNGVEIGRHRWVHLCQWRHGAVDVL